MKVKDLIESLSKLDSELEIGGRCRDGMFIPIEGEISECFAKSWDDILYRSDHKTDKEFEDAIKLNKFEKVALLNVTIRP